jgi:hypothetical protein
VAKAKGRLSQLKGVNPEEKMVHHRIAHKYGIHDQALINLCLSRYLGE